MEPLRRSVSPRDGLGVDVEFKVVHTVELEHSWVEGYVGPVTAIAESAMRDHIEIPRERPEIIVGVIAYIRVEPGQRRKGYGKSLLYACLREMVAHGAEEVYLRVAPSEDDDDDDCFDNVAFYQGRHFERLDPDRKTKDGDPDPEPVMIWVTATAARHLPSAPDLAEG